MRKNFPGFKYVKSSGGISEYRLVKNSLRVLIMEDHSSPTATVMVTYHVGSRNEATGYTGATHLLEHLMFKGSKKFPKGAFRLENVGALLNATTSFDRTNYFEVLPIGHLEEALAIEADRMRHAVIEKKHLDSEMTVVRNEFERCENEPHEALQKQIWAAAFVAHPYRHLVIGLRSDIENVPIERLKNFYDTFYWPGNATLIVVGDIEIEKTLKLASKHFGRHKTTEHLVPEVYTQEPPQEGQRRVAVRRHGQNGIVNLAFKIPNGLNQDVPALEILANVLGTGRSSRLHRTLADRGLAAEIKVGALGLRDPGLFIIDCLLADQDTHRQTEKLIWHEIRRIKEKGVSGKELARAKKTVEATLAYLSDGSYGVAEVLNESLAIGDWTLFARFPEMVKKVSAEEVKKATNKYLVEDQSTVGYFVPKKN